MSSAFKFAIIVGSLLSAEAFECTTCSGDMCMGTQACDEGVTMCMQMKTGDTMVQACGSSMCAALGNPTTCCKMESEDTTVQAICSTTDFEKDSMTAATFAGCDTACNVVVGDGSADDGGAGGDPCTAACPVMETVSDDCKDQDPKPEGEDVCTLVMTDACTNKINAALTCLGEKDACKEMKEMMYADKGTMACINSVGGGGSADDGGAGGDRESDPCTAACPVLDTVGDDCKDQDPKPEGEDVCPLDMTDACANKINAAVTCLGEKDACKEMKTEMDADKGTMACINSAEKAVADGAQEAKGIMVAAAALMSSLLV